MRRVGMFLCAPVCLGGLALLLLIAPVIFGSPDWSWSSGQYVWGVAPWAWGGIAFPFMGLAMLLFCALMMLGMMLRTRPLMHGAGNGLITRPEEINLGILEQRISRGEITTAQFEETKRDLGLGT